MKGILGEKIGMLQIWDENGLVQGVTAVRVEPCVVVQRKTEAKDGYNAIQVGSCEVAEKKLSKGEKGHLKGANEKTQKLYSRLYELRDYPGIDDLNVGDQLQCTIFSEGESVIVSGISKGKGFQGVVKRYGFGGGKATHGSNHHRAPGSIGAGTDPARVLRGKRMPGRMGGKKRSVKNLKIVKVIPEENLVLIKGAVPGPRGSEVLLYQN